MIRREFLKGLLSAPAVVALLGATKSEEPALAGEVGEVFSGGPGDLLERAVQAWGADPETGPYSCLKFHRRSDRQRAVIHVRMRTSRGDEFGWSDMFDAESPVQLAAGLDCARQVLRRMRREHGLSRWSA